MSHCVSHSRMTEPVLLRVTGKFTLEHDMILRTPSQEAFLRFLAPSSHFPGPGTALATSTPLPQLFGASSLPGVFGPISAQSLSVSEYQVFQQKCVSSTQRGH